MMHRWTWLLALATACSSPPGPEPKPPSPAAEESQKAARSSEDIEAEQIAAIQKAMNDASAGAYECRNRATADDLDLDGLIRIKVTLAAAGAVAKVEVAEDTIKDAVLSRCLVALWSAAKLPNVFAAGDVVEAPYEFVTDAAQYKIYSGHVKPTSSPEGQTLQLLTPKNTGNEAIALSMLVMADGYESPLGVSPNTQLWFVFVGAGEVKGLGKRGSEARAVTVNDGIYVPKGAPFAISDRKDGEQTVAFRLDIPAAGDGAAASPVADAAVRRYRGVRPHVRAGAGAEGLSIAGGKGRVDLYFDAASAHDPTAYMGVLTAQAGLAVPEHVHEQSTEVLFIAAGSGTMTVEGKEFAVRQGDAIQVPPNTKHSFIAATDVQALQFYSPSGPEQRFRPPPTSPKQ